MSLREEQYRSLKKTRNFLRDLLNPSQTPRVPSKVREQASRCLRHYPFLDEYGKPMFSRDDFGPDEPPPIYKKNPKTDNAV